MNTGLANEYSLTIVIVMEIKFEIQGGHKFSLEVDPSETIRDVKEKVQNSQHIPIPNQIILFHSELLPDYCVVSECHLYHGARIVLQISGGFVPSPVSDSDSPPQPQLTPELQLPPLPSKEYDPSGMPPWDPSLQLLPPADDYDPLAIPESTSEVIPMPHPPSKLKELEESPRSPSPLPQPHRAPLSPPQMVPHPLPPPPPTVTLNVKVPRSQDRIPIEMDKVETVLKLKEKIAAREEMRGVPVERIVLQSPTMRMELRDYQVLQNLLVSSSESPDIDVFLKPTLPVPGRKLKVKVIPRHSKHSVEIEVNSTDRVSVLRAELERLRLIGGFPLPADGGYFFIHKQMDMDENESFQWHQVREGDTIETFDGFISSTDAAASSSSSRPGGQP